MPHFAVKCVTSMLLKLSRVGRKLKKLNEICMEILQRELCKIKKLKFKSKNPSNAHNMDGRNLPVEELDLPN